MNYYIQKPDELYHYGVKGMRWGHRKDPERSSNSRRGMSTAKKIAIGVGVAAAVGGITYASIKGYKYSKYGKVTMASVKKVANRGAKTVRFKTTKNKPLALTGPVGLNKSQMRAANRNRKRLTKAYSRKSRFDNRDWLARTADNIEFERLGRDIYKQDPKYFLFSAYKK